MPKIELEEGEYNNLMALRGVALKIVANPTARRLLEQAQKTVDPNAPTPFLDQEKLQNEPLNALKTEMQAKIDKLEKEREDEKREATLQAIADRQATDFA